MANADPEIISTRALERGRKQLGTLGSGNHFLEVGLVDKVFDAKVAQAFGLFQGQVILLLHSGSRGFGYQVCDDYIKQMNQHVNEIGIELPDRQLACAMIQSNQGQLYFNAMACAANYAWANRQILMHRCHEVFQHALGISPKNLDMKLVYDVSHNIASRQIVKPFARVFASRHPLFYGSRCVRKELASQPPGCGLAECTPIGRGAR